MTRVAVVMDGGPERAAATLAALDHAGGARTEVVLLSTAAIDPPALCAAFDGLVIGPGGTNQRLDLVLEAIRTARERGVPLVGT